ncbi:MAG: DNA primase, partial [Syntrophales bacterium]|nr:DNA primase [Syntrophales bacterium]
MSGRIPADAIEEVRRRTDIVELVSSHVGLKKAGRNYIGLCPFHAEKTPSFTVSPDKQMYHCFGCGEGGNVFSFIMKVNGLTFVEAVRHLAQRAGVMIPEREVGDADRQRLGKREKLLQINALAQACFSRWLFSPAGEKARRYLAERGIAEETARRYSLGFAMDGWRHLRDYLQGRRVPLELAEEAGLVVRGETRGYYDRFRGRLIFPIHDVHDGVVAFGGRVINGGEPKYLNSPESPVYTKGRVLY